MINEIINTFRRHAREHKLIQAFYYNRSYEIGSGKDKYPLFWLEDPIYGENRENIFVNSVNFSILLLPNREQRLSEIQNLAFSAGLNIIERIKQNQHSAIRIHPDWTYTTLQNYYDDDACGCRFSVNFTQLNIQDLCLIEEQFEEQKEEQEESLLPNFDLFVEKLPQFNLRIKKHRE